MSLAHCAANCKSTNPANSSGSYTIAEADGVARGTKIVLELREGNHEFAKKQSVENIVKKYSNFVGFPISLNGKRINNIKALWTMNKDRITPEEHKEFYQVRTCYFSSHALHAHTRPVHLALV
jgi:TNF receptor-associated protein 1